MNILLTLTAAAILALYAAYQLVPPSALRWTARVGYGRGPAHDAHDVIVAAPLRPLQILALLVLWTVAALWETQPLYLNLGTAMPAGLDAAAFAWNLWWMKYALLTLHQFPFITNYVYGPQQVNLAFHTFTPLNGLLSIPLQLLFGLTAALDLLLLASFVAGALGAFLLTRQETGSTAGALVGSVAFPFAPYVMAHLSAAHINIVTTWAVPFFALYLLRWVRRRRPRDAALAGLFLGLDGLNDLNQIGYCLAFGALVVAYAAWKDLRTLWHGAPVQRTPRRANVVGVIAPTGAVPPLLGAPTRDALVRWLSGPLAVGAVATLVFLPEIVPFVDGLRHGWTTATPLQASIDFSPDLAGYITPLYLHPLWGPWAAGVATNLHFLDQPKIVFVGFTALALALVALTRRVWAVNVRLWWIATLLFWVLSLGPYLHAGGRIYPNIPLPYLLYHTIPIIGGGRIPGYASVIIALGLAVLAGHGIAALSARLPQRRRPLGSLALGSIAAFLVLFESLSTPLALYTPHADPVYGMIAHDPGRQAILDEPLGWRDGRISVGSPDTSQMYNAIVAGKPLVGGFVARVPDSFFQYYQNQPALAQLIVPDGPPTPESQSRATVRAALRRLGVGYIIVHQYPLYDRATAYVRTVIGAREIYADTDLTAYRMP